MAILYNIDVTVPDIEHTLILMTTRSFKAQHTASERAAMSLKIRAKYPDKTPVICEKNSKSLIPDISKKKYLLPSNLTVGHFLYVIRKMLKLPGTQAIYLCVNGSIPTTAMLMTELYADHADPDGFLYVQYCDQSAFGGF